MIEQNFEAKLVALDALIIKREAFFQTCIKKHTEFGAVKIIYMKIKLLKYQRAALLKKVNRRKAANPQLLYKQASIFD